MKQVFLSLVLGVGLCLAQGPSPVQAEEAAQVRATLTYNVPQGLQYSFQQGQVMNSALVVSGGGQSVNVQQQTQARLEGTAIVTQIRGGKPSQLRVRFSPNSGMQIVTNGSPSPQPFPFAGREVLVSVANDEIANVTMADGSPINADEDTRDLISSVVVFETNMLPGRPVGVGDQWTANIVEPDGSGRTTLNMTVAGFEQRGGRQIALLTGQGTIANSADGTSMNGPISARIALDVATGLPMEMQGTANVQINGSSVQEGQQIQLSGTGQIFSQLQIALNGQGVGGVQTQPFPQAPNQQVRPPQQPQRQAGPTPPGDRRIVGAFRGEAISSNRDLGIYVNTQLWWVFRPDGIVYYGAQTFFDAEKRDYNLRQEYTAHGNTPKGLDVGRWSTQGKFLTIQWNDGRRTYVAYGIEPDGTLVFRNARTGKIINYFPRVRG